MPAAASEEDKDALNRYISAWSVEDEVQDMVQSLLEAKPDNPKKFLLNSLEREVEPQISDADLYRIFEITRRVTSEIVPKETINIIIQETLKLLGCDTVSLFVLDKKTGMLVLNASNLTNPIRVNPGQGLAGLVFNTQETVNIPDCYADPRFDRSFDVRSGYKTKSLLAMAIRDFDDASLGVVQAINKRPRGGADFFTKVDEMLLGYLTQHVSIALRNAEVYREAITACDRVTGLLNTIQSLSQDLGSQSLILTCTMHANKIVSAERSTVFLVDQAKDQLWSVATDSGKELRVPMRSGIVGECCSTGAVVKIPDAYQDGRFNQEVDKQTGLKTTSILAVPVLQDDTSHVLGVIQMINKCTFDGAIIPFDDDDVTIMEAFAKFCAQKLKNSTMTASRADPSSEASRAFSQPRESLKITPLARRSVLGGPQTGGGGPRPGTESIIEEGEEEEES